MQEIFFSVRVILSYFGTGIASAAYAAAWGAPPDLCEPAETVVDDPCDRKPLTATTALQAVSRSKKATFGGVIPRG